MPFKKTKGGKYKSPSGKTYTKEQVKAYYATDGFKRVNDKRKTTSSKRKSGGK